MMSTKYCNDMGAYSRYVTREVAIGNLTLGGNNPIRVQSMTTTDTMDTIKTVEQSIRMIEAGCELVRITAPSINEAKNLQNIKDELRKRGYHTPLVADIHFTPNAAEMAARIVEKVRVNPGNYADKKKFEQIDYSNEGYDAELERIRNRFVPLIKICKEYGTAMRIGTNHGSLSDRIMSRYGDTPLGMVESALEFLRICEAENYYNIVLSMKASNPQVMVQAYRMLIAKMELEKMNYPLHLGVTEAGDGEDGRIKSAVGIGTLLEDGIGDTVRVSLTEDPEFEIPVALALVNRYTNRAKNNDAKIIVDASHLPYSPLEYNKRQTIEVVNVGGHNVPRVVIDLSFAKNISQALLHSGGYNYSVPLDKWNITDQACDFIFAGDNVIDFEIPGTLSVIYNYNTWLVNKHKARSFPLMHFDKWNDYNEWHTTQNFVLITAEQFAAVDINSFKQQIEKYKIVLVVQTNNEHAMATIRSTFIKLMNNGIQLPLIIKRQYAIDQPSTYQLHSATDCGALLTDGMGDGIWLTVASDDADKDANMRTKINPAFINSTSFGILQATRTRISKTDYISCPSCGRTLFDLQDTTARIRARTAHLKGLKIGIMGCIVNGPGEMADADYGYVGVGVGKITLYKGKEVVERNIDEEQAVEALINLIKQHGDWKEEKAIEELL